MQWIQSFNRNEKFRIEIHESFSLNACNVTKSTIEHVKTKFFHRKRIDTWNKIATIWTNVFACIRKLMKTLTIVSCSISSSFNDKSKLINSIYFRNDMFWILIINNVMTMHLILFTQFNIFDNCFVRCMQRILIKMIA